MGRETNRCAVLEPRNSLRKEQPVTMTDRRGEVQGLCLWFSSRSSPALVSSETLFTLKWHAVSMCTSCFSRSCTRAPSNPTLSSSHVISAYGAMTVTVLLLLLFYFVFACYLFIFVCNRMMDPVYASIFLSCVFLLGIESIDVVRY